VSEQIRHPEPEAVAPTGEGEKIRNGGDLVVETLEALGTTTVFGIPGQHALGLFDALRRSGLHFMSSRVENNAAFAADGYARVSGKPAALFLSTGPGALTALPGLQEAYATSVPMVVVASQVPVSGLGGARRGMLHQLDEQRRAAIDVTKSQRTVTHHAAIPTAIESAWVEAMTYPRGPVWVEVPQDVLLAKTEIPPIRTAVSAPTPEGPRPELVWAAVKLLAGAKRPAIVAGGGVRRTGAERALLALAEKLDAPVVCSPGGNSGFPVDHPLSMGSWVEDRAVTDLLADADVLLAVGTSLGEVTSNYFTLKPAGKLIHVDAEPRVLESNHPALGIACDAKAALDAFVAAFPAEAPAGRASGAARAAEARKAIVARLDGQDLAHERAFMDAIRAGIPDEVPTFWDMTIAAYWAWNCWDGRSGGFHSGQGAGGLGFAFPAALGGAVALAEKRGAKLTDVDAAFSVGGHERVVAVAGDGSSMYSIAELATAVQHGIPVTWLIVDDGGYGILREYMEATFGQATHTELARPDFVALAESFGVEAQEVAVGDEVGYDELTDALRATFAADVNGPRVIVVKTHLEMFAMS